MSPTKKTGLVPTQAESQKTVDLQSKDTLSGDAKQAPIAPTPPGNSPSPQAASTATTPPEVLPPTGSPLSEMIVSIVSGATDTVTRDIAVGKVLEGIRSGLWKDPVVAIRSTYGEAQAQINDPKFREVFIQEQRRAALEKGAKPDKAEQMVEQSLANYPKKKIAPLKKVLPAVMFSGVFARRNADAIKKASGLLCADLDTLGPRLKTLKDELKRDPYVFAVLDSPSGDGLKVPVRIPPEVADFKRAFDSVRAYFHSRYGVEIDQACSDISRLCFVSYDPEMGYNNSAIPLPLLSDEEIAEIEQKEKPKLGEKATTSRAGKGKADTSRDERATEKGAQKFFDLDRDVVRRFLELYPDDHDASKVVSALEFIDPSDEKTWRDIGMALKSKWGDDAWELFDEWSAHGGGYDEHENGKRWDSFDDNPDAGISLGTVFHHAKENGWKFRDKKTVILPTRSNTAFCRAVYRIMAPKDTVFLQGGGTVCIEVIDGQDQIVPVDAIKGIRLFERHIQFLKEKVEENEGDEPTSKYVPVALSEHHSQLLVKGVQPGELPELKGITRCPPLIAMALNRIARPLLS